MTNVWTDIFESVGQRPRVPVVGQMVRKFSFNNEIKNEKDKNT